MDKSRADVLIENMQKVIVGKYDSIFKVIAALLAGGHILIEDVPGVGKTQMVSALAKSVNGEFNRIQLTPDIMPSDIVGFSMIDNKTRNLEYKKGAAFCNFLLADEINRASPKAQSALLESMEEHQVSIDGQTHKLPFPFMVLATQNPVETYGTYHLPEAQMDRFLMKISMGYPSADEELSVLKRTRFSNPIKSISSVITVNDIIDMQEQVKNIRCAESVMAYIISICEYTRNDDGLRLGVSPRGSIGLYKASMAAAFLHGRDYVVPEDVKEMAECVLSHRIMLAPKGKSDYVTAENAVKAAISSVPVPTAPNA